MGIPNTTNYPDEHNAEAMLRHWLDKGRGSGNGFGWLVERTPDPERYAQDNGLYECSVCKTILDRADGAREYHLLGVFRVDVCEPCHDAQYRRLLPLAHLRKYAGKPLAFHTPWDYEDEQPTTGGEATVQPTLDQAVDEVLDRAGVQTADQQPELLTSKQLDYWVRKLVDAAGSQSAAIANLQKAMRVDEQNNAPPAGEVTVETEHLTGWQLKDFDFSDWRDFDDQEPDANQWVDLMRVHGKGSMDDPSTIEVDRSGRHLWPNIDTAEWPYWRPHKLTGADNIVGVNEQTGELVAEPAGVRGAIPQVSADD